MIAFTDEQQTKLIEFLEIQRDAGLSIDEVIEGLINGTFLKPKGPEHNPCIA